MKLKENFKRFWTLSKSRKGFTLVELIVVIAILAILAGVAIPVYNGYIKKAQTAADQTLLDSINTAFTATCVANGLSQYDVASANLPIKADGSVGTLSSVKLVNGNTPAEIYETFEMFFAGNETSKFNTFKALAYENGMFVNKEISGAYAALLGSFSAADIAALNNSTFGQMGVAGLLGSVDLASGVASSLLSDPENLDPRVQALVTSDSNMNTLAQVLGCESAQDEDFMEKYGNLLSQKVTQLKNNPQYSGYTDEQLEDVANATIMSNNAILSAATNSNFNSSAFVGQLASGGAKESIKGNLASGGDLQTGLSQAAITYALYTSYAQKNGIAVSQDNALNSVLNALDDEGFKAYANSADATKDVEGYLAAMNMVNSSYENKDVATDILLNGFNNDDLTALLQNALG